MAVGAPQSSAALAPAQITRSSSAGAPGEKVAFVDVAVIPMDTERVLSHQTIIVENDRITALGPTNAVRVPSDALQIDGRNMYLLPGLADMHVHLEKLTPAEAEVQLFLLLANGVTTIRNVDYTDDSGERALQLRRRVRADELWSPRIYTAGKWWTSRAVKTVSEITDQLTAYKAAGYDFVKVHDEPAVLIDSIARAAYGVNIPLVGHVMGSLEHALGIGYASIEHLTGYPEYLRGQAASPFFAWINDSSAPPMDLAKIPVIASATHRAGVWNTPTLFMKSIDRRLRGILAQQPEMCYTPARLRKAWAAAFKIPRLHTDIYDPITKGLQDARAGLLLGTDAGVDYVLPGFSVHRELEALVHAGLTPYQSLSTGTRNVAAFLQRLDESGTVAIGQRADLVLLTGNPLDDIRHTAQPAGVMIGGRWLPRKEIDRRLEEIAAVYASTP